MVLKRQSLIQVNELVCCELLGRANKPATLWTDHILTTIVFVSRRLIIHVYCVGTCKVLIFKELLHAFSIFDRGAAWCGFLAAFLTGVGTLAHCCLFSRLFSDNHADSIQLRSCSFLISNTPLTLIRVDCAARTACLARVIRVVRAAKHTLVRLHSLHRFIFSTTRLHDRNDTEISLEDSACNFVLIRHSVVALILHLAFVSSAEKFSTESLVSELILGRL